MKKILLAIALALVSLPALADGYDLSKKSISEFSTYSAAPASSDKLIMWDNSANTFVRLDATAPLLEDLTINDDLTVTDQISAAGLTVNATNGTAISAIRFAFDAVANGQTSKTTTLTGATASSRCVASAAETATNAVYIRSVVPGTNQVVITTSGDPGASNLDFTVICLN